MRILYFILLITINIHSVFGEWQEINTGIKDNFLSIVVKTDYGLMCGSKGLYFTNNGGNSGGSWLKFAISSSSKDYDAFNRTRFVHISTDSIPANLLFYTCGQDTINNTAMIWEIDLKTSAARLIYTGKSKTNLKRIAYNNYYKFYTAVGDSSLLVNFKSDTYKEIKLLKTLNLNSISYDLSYFIIGGNGFTICGYGDYNSLYFSYQNNCPSMNFRDVLSLPEDCSGLAVSDSIYGVSGNNMSVFNNFNYGNQNANCLLPYKNKYYYLVGTDHGIFELGLYSRISLWEPSSKKYLINSICRDFNNNHYAVCNNGLILFSNTDEITTLPYLKMSLKDACLSNSEYQFVAVLGSSDYLSYKWYLNDSLISTQYKFSYLLSKAGKYKVRMVIQDKWGNKDSAAQTINIWPFPGIKKKVSVLRTMLCKEEQTVIYIDSAESDVIYTLKKFGDYQSTYGSSQIGQNKPISFLTSLINSSGYYYLHAQNAYCNCTSDFKDTITITVEHTKADMHTQIINATKDEMVNFYENCIDANNYKWEFSPDATPTTSNKANPGVSFNKTGKTSGNLIAWSDNGCYDTTNFTGPTIYSEPQKPDSCWTLVNNSIDPSWPGYYNPDIRKLIKSRDGFLVLGNYYKDEIFVSKIGDSLHTAKKGGGFLCKYNYSGVLKWIIYFDGDASTNSSLGLSSIAEDGSGYIYICGSSATWLWDNTGMKISLNNGSWITGFLVKLDSLGRFIWKLDADYLFPDNLAVDHSGNIVMTSLLSYQIIKNIGINLNNKPIYTVKNNFNPIPNCVILKISSNGSVIWDNEIYLYPGDNQGMVDIGFDKFDNVYCTGRYNNRLVIHSYGSTKDTLILSPSPYGPKLILIKYDRNGNYIWKVKSYVEGSNSNNNADPISLAVDDNGNCYISGSNDWTRVYTDSNQVFENTDGSFTKKRIGSYFIAKVNSAGICEWIQGNKSSKYGYGYKVDILGDEISVLGQVLDDPETGKTCIYTSSNNICAQVKVESSDFFIAYYNPFGNLKRIVINGNNPKPIIMNNYGFPGYFRLPDGSSFCSRNIRFYFGGKNYNNFGTIIDTCNGIDGTITRFYEKCGITYYPDVTGVEDTNPIKLSDEFIISPNPATDFIEIFGGVQHAELLQSEIRIYDVYGQNCDLTPTLSKCGEGVRIDVSGLAPGVYFVRVGDRVCKFVKI